MKILLILTILNPLTILSLLSCSGNDSTRMEQFSHLTETEEASYDTLITLARDESWGLGPRYRLWITARGKVLFEGSRYTKDLRYRTREIGPNKFGELLEAFRTSGILELSSRSTASGCKQYFTDAPNVFFTIKLGGVRKEVEHYTGCIGFTHETSFLYLEGF